MSSDQTACTACYWRRCGSSMVVIWQATAANMFGIGQGSAHHQQPEANLRKKVQNMLTTTLDKALDNIVRRASDAKSTELFQSYTWSAILLEVWLKFIMS